MTVKNRVAVASLGVLIAAGTLSVGYSQGDLVADPSSGGQKVEGKREEHKKLLQKKIELQAADAAKAAGHAARTQMFTIHDFPGVFQRGGSPVELSRAAEKVRDAKDEAAKTAATTELTKLIDKYFDDDMQHRAEELDSIAVRLDRLKAQLDRRREKKQEIVDLQVKVAINDAEGLGFYSQPQFMVAPPLPAYTPNVMIGTPVPTVQPPPLPPVVPAPLSGDAAGGNGNVDEF